MGRKPQTVQQTPSSRILRSRKGPTETNPLKRSHPNSLQNDDNKKQRGKAHTEPIAERQPLRRSSRRLSQLVPTSPSKLESHLNETDQLVENSDDHRQIPDAKLPGPQSPESRPKRRSYRRQSQVTTTPSLEPQGPQNDDNRTIPRLSNRRTSQLTPTSFIEPQDLQNNDSQIHRHETIDFSAAQQSSSNCGAQSPGLVPTSHLFTRRESRKSSTAQQEGLQSPGFQSPVLQQPPNRSYRRLSQQTSKSPSEVQDFRNVGNQNQRCNLSPAMQSHINTGLHWSGSQPSGFELSGFQSPRHPLLAHPSPGLQSPSSPYSRLSQYSSMTSLAPQVDYSAYQQQGFQPSGFQSQQIQSPGFQSAEEVNSPGMQRPGRTYRRLSQFTPPGTQNLSNDENRRQSTESVDFSPALLPNNNAGFNSPGFQSTEFQQQSLPYRRLSQYTAIPRSDGGNDFVDYSTAQQLLRNPGLQSSGLPSPELSTNGLHSPALTPPGLPLLPSPGIQSPGLPSQGFHSSLPLSLKQHSPEVHPPSYPHRRSSQLSTTSQFEDESPQKKHDFVDLTTDLPENDVDLQRAERQPAGGLHRKQEPEIQHNDDSSKQRCEFIDLTAVYHPVNTNTTRSSGHRPSGHYETDSQYLLYIRDLSTEIVHHELFEHFCLFGNLKRVSVFQRTETYRFATILFSSSKSLKLAFRANPHNLRGRQYFCHKAGPWHLGCFRSDWQMSEDTNRSIFRERYQIKVPYGVHARCYSYKAPVNVKDAKPVADQSLRARGRRSALLPQSSVALLHYLRKDQAALQAPVEQVLSDLYPQTLFSAMGKKFKFVRHSYTNFVAHRKQPGQFETVPIKATIGLTSVAYADLRDKPDLIAFYYQNA